MEWKRKLYAKGREHDKTHKVSELLDQNNNTPFYLYHNKKNTQIIYQEDNLVCSTREQRKKQVQLKTLKKE